MHSFRSGALDCFSSRLLFVVLSRPPLLSALLNVANRHRISCEIHKHTPEQQHIILGVTQVERARTELVINNLHRAHDQCDANVRSNHSRRSVQQLSPFAQPITCLFFRGFSPPVVSLSRAGPTDTQRSTESLSLSILWLHCLFELEIRLLAARLSHRRSRRTFTNR